MKKRRIGKYKYISAVPVLLSTVFIGKKIASAGFDAFFLKDLKIVLITVKKVFFKRNTFEENDEIDVTLDYGDALLESGEVSQTTYNDLQNYAKQLLEETV